MLTFELNSRKDISASYLMT